MCIRASIQRFHHPGSFRYIHPKMEELLKETYGVMVYQEDVIKVAHHFAGLDPADADILRRGMSGKFSSAEAVRKGADTLTENCKERGLWLIHSGGGRRTIRGGKATQRAEKLGICQCRAAVNHNLTQG